MSTAARASVVLDGDVGPLRQKLRQATQDIQQFGSSAAAPLQALGSKFVGISAALAGGALFGAAVKEAADFTEQATLLGQALGTSATVAGGWIGALEDAGATTGEMSTASAGLLRNLRENEGALNKLGLATRDSTGKLRPMNELMLDAIKVVNEHEQGTSRNLAAQQVFGKSVDGSSKMLRVNVESLKETIAFQQQLGLVVGQEQVQAFEEYDSAIDRSALVLKALRTTVGQALMPVLTRLAEWFNAVGPAGVTVIRGAIGGLVSVFWGLKNAVTMAFEIINAAVISAAEPIRAVAAAMWKMVQGDFSGAAAELTNVPKRIGAAWSAAWSNIVASSRDSRDKIAALFLDGPAAPKAAGGKILTPDPKPGKEGGSGKASGSSEASKLAVYELELAEMRRRAAVESEGRELSKQEELAYWRAVLQSAVLGTNDRIAVLRKTSALEVDIARAAASQRKALDDELASQAQARALGEVEFRRASAQAQFEAGQITRAQMLALDDQYERERYQIQRAALERRLQLLAADPTLDPVARQRVLGEIEALDRQYELKRIELQSRKGQERDEFDAIGERAGAMLQDVLTGARTWSESMRSIFAQAGAAFIAELVTKPFALWLANQARMLAVKLGFLTKEQAMQMAASAGTVGIKTAETTAVVAANAAQAGTGAAASQAAIPIVGPGLALAAMAAIFAAVMAMGAGRKSAAGGYDIPSGMNPLTQLHEEEMVLPKHLANAVRAMAAPQGGGGDMPPPVTVEMRSMSVGDWMMVHQKDFARLLTSLEANRTWRARH